MRPHALRALGVLVLLAVLPAGCRRVVRPQLGEDRAVEAGTPLAFGAEGQGAPRLTWDAGDGTPPVTAPRFTHAWERTGRYVLRALDGKEELGRVTLTVVPRPALRAIPPDAEVALWLPTLERDFVPLVGFAEALVGEANAQELLARVPILPAVRASLQGPPEASAWDREEGLGMFVLPGAAAGTFFIGVADPQAALAQLMQGLEEAGARTERRPDGSVRLQSPEGDPALAFVDRGYLYLAIPETAADGEPPAPGQEVAGVLEAVRARVTGAAPDGLSRGPRLAALQGKVAPGHLYVFGDAEAPDAEAQGVLTSVKVGPRAAELDGFLATRTPVFAGTSAPASPLLGRAPEGPVAALQVSVPPAALVELVAGAPGSARRARWLKRLGDGDAEALLAALRGDVGALAYFDAAAFFSNLLRGSRRPEPRGALWVEAGLSQREPVERFVRRLVEESPLRVDEVRQKGLTRWRARLLAQPLELALHPDLLALHAGEPPRGRAEVDVAARLRERMEHAEAFTPGHLSAFVDLGQLREELDRTRSVPGIAPERLATVRALAAAFLDQLTPLDFAHLDLHAEEGGARLRGRLVLRGDGQEAAR